METRRLIANWKMNLPPEGVETFVSSLSDPGPGVELGIAPPFPFLTKLVSFAGSGGFVAIGGQNCSDQESGAFTGEVSAEMLRQVGARFVIVGHSERRHLFHENSALVGAKARRVAAAGMLPVVCVGEQESSREAGETESVLDAQLTGFAEGFGGIPSELVLAYEPVWAIGTGKTATPQVAGETHAAIRRIVERLSGSTSVAILYGGSVTPDNAAELAATPGIDGFLVGGASLASGKFRAIAAALAAAREKS